MSSTHETPPSLPSTPTQPPYPLHPSIIPRLDPTYTTFYNAHLQNNQVVHQQPIPVSRSSGILLPGASDPLPVGSILDLNIPGVGSNLHNGDNHEPSNSIPVRAFIPKGTAPGEGWPLCMYFHGGGWVLGDISTENTVCSNLCARGDVVVVTVDYRLSPEHPYPAALDDCQTALVHILTHFKELSLPINPSLVALAGSSAGGNIAAVLSQRFCSPDPIIPPPIPIRISLQLLIVPVLDNSALPGSKNPTYPSWTENEYSPALPAAKMLWFRKHYLPQEERWREVDASPLLNEGGWECLPRTMVVVGELDVLRDEGIVYAEKLNAAINSKTINADKGKEKCRLVVWKGMPHPFLAMDGVMKQGADTISYMVEELRDVFWKQ